MEEAKVELTLLSQQVGGEIWLGEFLLLPELTTVAAGQDSVWRGLTALAGKFLADLPAGELWRRMAGGELEPLQIQLDLRPPKGSVAWRAAARLIFHAIKWQRPEGAWVAYAPLVKAAVVVEKEGALAPALEHEIRLAIQRSNPEGHSGGINLQSVALLGRVEAMAAEKVGIAITLKSPKTRQRELAREKAEKSALHDCATDLTTSPPDSGPPRPAKAHEIRDLVEKIAEALTGRNARSVLLVGPSGVGKSAAIGELVRLRDDLGLGGRTFWQTSGSRLIMGAMGYGMWQERCHSFCREAGQTRAIVALGNLIELLEVGKSESNAIGIAGQLRGYMQRGTLLAIAECTPEQAAVLEREDPHLLAAFRQVAVEEPSAAKSRAILRAVARDLTAGDPRRRGKDWEQQAVLTDAALEEILRLHRRFATYSALPGRPIRFLQNLIHDSQGRQLASGATITAAQVAAAFSRETGLPAMLLDDAIPLELQAARDWFAARVLAQPDAVAAVVDLLAAVKAALNRPRRPIASLLFIGPTGVGKTEMAKALAEYCFADSARLTRFDMSEYATPAAVTRLVGSWGAQGLLTARVRQHPFSVVLLDEVEKADAAFFDLMLQVLGEGRLTDAAGRVADFSNCIVIMTSNLGAASFGRGAFGLKEARSLDPRSHFVEEVRAFLRPELFNRLDRIVPFLPLDAAAIRGVARREVDLVKGRDGLRLRDIALELAEAAVDTLAEIGFDAAYGARPLKRAIERELLAPLANALNSCDPGAALHAAVGLEGGKLTVQVRSAAKKGRAPVTGLGPAIARRASALRRQVQRLDASGAALQLKNELFQLERRIERAALRRKAANLELPAWRERLKIVRQPAALIEALLRETVAAEEEALLAFYERRVPEAGRDWIEALATMEKRLWQALLALYCLRYAQPDRVSVGIFADKESRLLELARAYAAVCEKRGFELRLAWFQRDARGLVRYREQSAKKYLADAAAKPLGIVLEIHGPSAAPLFIPEAGWHTFENQGKKSYCQVLTADGALADLQPPDEIHRSATPPAGFARRTVDLFNHTADDAYTEKPEPWQRLDLLVERLMESRLRQLIAEPLGGED